MSGRLHQSPPSADPAGQRILHLVHDLHPGGTEGQCARVAMGLRERGRIHCVAVFRRTGALLEAVEETCGPVYELPIRRRISMKTRREMRRFRDHLCAERIDLLHAWDADADIFGATAARAAGIPYLTSHRDLCRIYAPWKLRRMAAAGRAARRVVINARAIQPVVEDFGVDPGKIRVLPNLMDLAEFDLHAQYDSPPVVRKTGCINVGLVSRLDPEKDVSCFVDALETMGRGGAKVHGWIAGEGAERARLETRIRRMGPTPNVTLLGRICTVPAFLRWMEIGVLVSVANEGLSNAILEYMAAGLPVVASDCGGNTELVRHRETGLVVPAGDPDALAQALGELIRQPDRMVRYGASGRQQIEREYAKDDVLDRFDALYDELSNL